MSFTSRAWRADLLLVVVVFGVQHSDSNSKPMSTAAAPKYGKTFQQTWLSDQGAWPIIGILGGEWQQQHRQIPPKVRRRRSSNHYGRRELPSRLH